MATSSSMVVSTMIDIGSVSGSGRLGTRQGRSSAVSTPEMRPWWLAWTTSFEPWA